MKRMLQLPMALKRSSLPVKIIVSVIGLFIFLMIVQILPPLEWKLFHVIGIENSLWVTTWGVPIGPSTIVISITIIFFLFLFIFLLKDLFTTPTEKERGTHSYQ